MKRNLLWMIAAVLILLIQSSIAIIGQDLLARKAPVDRNMKETDSTFINKLVKDAKEQESEEIGKVSKIETPIIVDIEEGWEWIQKEEHFFHDDSYPIKMSYYTFKSHPQYKVLFDYTDYINGNMNNYAVYKSNGSLVRVGMITYETSFDGYFINDEVIKELLRHVYIKDFRNNKYNFSKENTKAQNYVKKELKLIPDYVTLQNFFQTYSEVAVRYLEQLKKDHKYDFANPLKCERINNLSFKVTFGNSDDKPTNTYKITYTSKGTFKYGINISDLPLEQIDWAQYKSQIPIDNVEDEIEEGHQFRIREGINLHKVKRGETLQSIARKLHIRVEELCKLNNIGKNYHLKPGQILKYYYGGSKYELSSPDINSIENDKIENQEKQTDSDFMLDEAIDTTRIYNANEIDEPPHFSGSLIDNETIDQNKIFDVVDEMPQYPGGPSALFEYLSKSVQYPVVAEENGVQGRVICTFVVETDGSISDVKVVKGVDPSLDKEAKRVISAMPRWIPGKNKGTPVRVKYTTPVTFKLQ